MKFFNAKQTSAEAPAEQLAQEVGAEADGFLLYRHPKARRVAALADVVARSAGVGDADRFALRVAAHLHHAGMLAMKRDYIARQGTLTPDERLDLARHPVVAEGEAARIGFARDVQLLVRWQHERWDGDGYPDALEETRIPLPARILRVVDSYVALTDSRPWREALTREAALQHLHANAGLEFDPKIVHLFSRIDSHSALMPYAVVSQQDESHTSDASRSASEISGEAAR